MKKFSTSLKFACAMATMSLACSIFAQDQKYEQISGKSASEITYDTNTIVTAGGVNGTFTVDKSIAYTDFYALQFGGGGVDIKTFTFNFTNGSELGIERLIFGKYASDAVLTFQGDGSVKLGSATLRSTTNPTTSEPVNTTWDFNQSGGVTMASSQFTVDAHTIVNIAKLNSSASGKIILVDGAKLNIGSHDTVKTENFDLGEFDVKGTAELSVTTTGATVSNISKFTLAEGAKASFAATNANGSFAIANASKLGNAVTGLTGNIKNLSYDGANASISAKTGETFAIESASFNTGAIFTSGVATLKNISWNDSTKTGIITYKGGYQGASFSVYAGATVTADNGGSTLEGSFSFTNPTEVTVIAEMFVKDNGSLDVSGSEGSIKLSKNTITTKSNVMLSFNSSNAMATTTAGSTQKDINLTIARNNATMYINADNDFGKLYLSGNNSKPYIEINITGNTVSFKEVGMHYTDGSSYIWFRDFIDFEGKESGKIFVSTQITDLNEDGSLKNIFAGEDKVALYQREDGSLSISAVIPEPAEWAAIFGALALGFVAYRRRK